MPGDHIQEVRNENYWDSPKPYVDEYRINIFRDQQSMIAALEAGALDVAALAPIPDAVRLKSNPKFQIYDNHEVGQFFYATVNTNVPPTDNKLLRQAIGYAIDRKRFTDNDHEGLRRRAQGPAVDVDLASLRAGQEHPLHLRPGQGEVAGRSSPGVTNPEFDINWALAGFSAEYQALATVIQARPGQDRHQDQPQAPGPADLHRAGPGRKAARSTACG